MNHSDNKWSSSPRTANRMPNHCSRAVFVILVALLWVSTATADDYDARTEFNRGFSASPSHQQFTSSQALERQDTGVTVTFDRATGAARTISNRVDYLTPARSGEALAIGLDYVRENLDLIGLSLADLDAYEIADSVYSAVTGATHIYLAQKHQGITVYNAQLHLNINRDGRILSINNSFLPEIAEAASSPIPSLNAAQALMAATEHLGMPLPSELEVVVTGESLERRTVIRLPAVSAREIESRLMWLPIRQGMARLVWNFQVSINDRTHWYDFTVDADSGKIWTRFDWVDSASYRVFELPVESPNHSSSPPPADGRTVTVDPADPTASPLGWHDDGTTSYTILQGNNVDVAPPGAEPDCGESLTCEFDFPIDFGTADPNDYTDAVLANLFYWANTVHDIQYQYGFDEAAGNFQANNFANGGLGGDDVLAWGQRSATPCPNNAFFATPPDGSQPEMMMCLWTLSSPRRDFSWDAGVMTHEYGHGISNRLVGGPSNVSCLTNLQQPGEGLSDWWALAYTGEVGDAGTDIRGSGTYILGQPLDGPGVRGLPYSTDPAVNTWTYESIDGASVPHGVGAVWAQVAWEAYWALVDHHGFDPNLYDALGGSGNQRMMLYVNEGLKNTACSPAFTDVRDGIIQAAVDNYGGGDVCRLWEAFAAFGLGTDAVSGGPSSLDPTEGFEVPAECLSLIFADGFETGDTTIWSSTTP